MDTFDRERTSDAAQSFAREASKPQTGFLAESWLFLRANKKWWLTPIVVTLLIVGALVVLGATPVAPFIYALF